MSVANTSPSTPAPMSATPTSSGTILSPAAVRDGYPSLAKWIARDPDSETFIFRSFKQLSAHNLLILETQVIVLEDKLNSLDEQIRKDRNLDLRQCLRRWESFVQLSSDPTYAIMNERMKVVNDLQSKLKEYHEALLLQAQISTLRQPRDGALRAFRSFFNGHNPRAGQILAGKAKNMLDDAEDLISLKAPGDRALLVRILRNHWPSKAIDRNSERYGYFLEERVQQVVAAINVLVAAILLVGAIVWLYYTRSPGIRLTLVAVFTSVFAISVVLFTNANRAEVFAATAAYSAVLVVFVSGEFAQNT